MTIDDTDPIATEPDQDLTQTTTEDQVTETPTEDTDDAESETDKRIARLAFDAREAKRTARRLEQENQVLRGQRQAEPNAELDRQVHERASQIAAETKFTENCNSIYDLGVKEFGKAKFDNTVKALNETLGGAIPPALIESAMDAGDAHRLLQYLGDNSDIAEDIANMPNHKMGVALAKLSSKLSDKPKAVSKAPAPIRPVAGSSSPEFDMEKGSLAEFMRLQDEHDRKRRFN